MSADTIERLNEEALRRPTFREGYRVRLADGQEWSLARPFVRMGIAPDAVLNGAPVALRPIYALDGSYQYGKMVNDLDQLWVQYGEGSVGFKEIVSAEIGLAMYLLLVNYDLTSEQISGLIQFAYGSDEDEQIDPEGFRMREEVMSVARGNGPKASAGGASSMPTPPA